MSHSPEFMNCDFSDPVDFQGNPQTQASLPFAFKTLTCNIQPLATLSGEQSQQIASTSAVSFTPDINIAMGTSFALIIFLLLVIVFFLAFDFGKAIYRR
jgi:hypothetical protein